MSIGLFFLFFNLQKFIHELGHLLMAKRAGIVVEEFGIGYPPSILKLGQGKNTIYTLNWVLFGSFIKMLGEKDATIPEGFASKNKLTRLSVLAVGPILNLITMALFLTPSTAFFTLAHMSGASEPITGINSKGEEASIATTIISEVLPDTPADKAGLQPGDIVTGADETEFKYVGDLVTYIEGAEGVEITLHIQRERRPITIPVVPRIDPPQGQGGLGIGIIYEDIKNKITYYPLSTALVKGVESTAEYSWLAIYLPIILSRDIIFTEEAGPIVLAESNLILPPTRIETTRWSPFFFVLGILIANINVPIVLATVISLLPLPGWDNWRILALIFEKR